MNRRTIVIYAATAALVLASGPAFAQENPPVSPKQSSGSEGARPNPGGGGSGTAVSRPSGGESGSSVAGSSSVARPSGGSSVSSGSDSFRPGPERPERRVERPQAVPRGEAYSPDAGERRRVDPRGAHASAGENSGGGDRAVPAYARPRDGRTPIGTAVERQSAPRSVRDVIYSYDPYYRYSYYYNRSPYGYYWPGYGFGVGYFYDPWMWGSFSPYGIYDPYYGGGYSAGYSRYRAASTRPLGSVRLKVKPEFGQVFVDGYYVGEVDSFDGVFQRLTIEEGPHRIEIRAEGYEPVQFEVMVIPGETVTYKGDLKRIQ
ncbi:MAG TPA: PEGA domain-containing protein [Vicinamibacterales bacterium]|nr:PEGA domain-containing protein [Vicinamibacterales bacterium]